MDRARGFLFTAMVVDALGTGLFGPFDLLYGHAVTSLPLWLSGVALSVGTAVTIPLGPWAGVLVDRVGAVRVTLAANAISALGCAILLVARDAWAFGLAVALLAGGSRIFWAAFSPLVMAVAGSDRTTWFGRIRSLRYAGLTGGQALAGALLIVGQVRGLQLLVAGDALSFVVAVIFMSGARGGAVHPAHPPAIPAAALGGYQAALRDRANVALAGLNVLATLVLTIPLIAMPVLVLDQLRLAPWMPGMLASLNTAAVALPAFFAGRLLRGRQTLQVLVVTALLWALAAGAMGLGALDRFVAYGALPVGMVLIGVGEAAYAPTADALPLDLAPAEMQGRYAALHQMAWGVSGAIAPALTAVLLESGRGLVWGVVGALAIALAVGYRLAEGAIGNRIGRAVSS